MISSLKKASCSELTALQSTKALTRFRCGLLPEAWRRHVIDLYWLWNLPGSFPIIHRDTTLGEVEDCDTKELDRQAECNGRRRWVFTIAFLRGREIQVTAGEDGGAGTAAAGVRPGLFPTRLQYSSSWLLIQLGDNTPHFPCAPAPLLLRRYDVVFPELERQRSHENMRDRARPPSYPGACLAARSHLTGPMQLWVDVGGTPAWPSQVCLCALGRVAWPSGDLGGLALWFSVLGEGGPCLACVGGLEEWEAGMEQLRGRGLPSCVVIEIWGSEQPAHGQGTVKYLKERDHVRCVLFELYMSYIHTHCSSLPLWMDLAGSGGANDVPEGALLAGGFLYRKSRFSYVWQGLLPAVPLAPLSTL